MIIPLFKPYYSKSMARVADKVLKSGEIASGQYVKKFSESIKNLINANYVVTTNNMTSALLIALKIIGIEYGDEIVTTPFACMSTNSAILVAGAKPVWVDLDPATCTVDISHLKKVVTTKTKAMILYHLAGYPNQTKDIQIFCKSRNIELIEDCDNALLAEVDNLYVGTSSRFGILSFYPNRHINTIEGGALICEKYEDALRAEKLIKFGIDQNKFRDKGGEISSLSDIAEIGWNAPLNNLSSAIGCMQINKVISDVERRRKNALYYNKIISNSKSVWKVKSIETAKPSYWVYLIQAKDSKYLIEILKSNNIGCSKLHYLNYNYKCFGYKHDSLKGCEDVYNSIIALPCGAWLKRNNIEKICNIICSRH